MGLILPDLKGNVSEFGGGYKADGAGNVVKIGGMYFADGNGNITKMFALASNSGGGDDNLMFADTDFVMFKDFSLKIIAPGNTFTNNTYTNRNVYQNGITLSKKVSDCPNGVQLNFNVVSEFTGSATAGWNGTDWNAPRIYLIDSNGNPLTNLQVPKTIADSGSSAAINIIFKGPSVIMAWTFYFNITNNVLKIYGSFNGSYGGDVTNKYYYVPVIHSITSY